MTPQVNMAPDITQPIEILSTQKQQLIDVNSLLDLFQNSPYCYVVENYPEQNAINNNMRSILLIVHYLPWVDIIIKIVVGIILLPLILLPCQYRPARLQSDKRYWFRLYKITNFEAPYVPPGTSGTLFSSFDYSNDSLLEAAATNKCIALIKIIGNTRLEEGSLSPQFFNIIIKAHLYKNVHIMSYDQAVAKFSTPSLSI